MSDNLFQSDLGRPPLDLMGVIRLTKEMKDSAKLLGPQEARFLVDEYYARQEDRIRTQNQHRALETGNSLAYKTAVEAYAIENELPLEEVTPDMIGWEAQKPEPNLLVGWIAVQNEAIEIEIRKMLDVYSDSNAIGVWMRSISGIGPVIAAGVLAHLDITKTPTVGGFWKYAGFDPSVSWEKGQKRPWNAKLKTLLWKMGESFVKTSNLEADYYGKVWASRKKLEVKNNDDGKFILEAERAIAKRKFGKDTEALLWYSGKLPAGATKRIQELKTMAARQKLLRQMQDEVASRKTVGQPMLPPAHLHARAKRYAVKLFLSHLHHVWYVAHYGELPPRPYAIDILKHAHYLPPPNHVYAPLPGTLSA